MVPYGKEIIEKMRSWKGRVFESPKGSNNGPSLHEVLDGSGWQPGYAWCLFAAMQATRFAVPKSGTGKDLWFRTIKHGDCDLFAQQATEHKMVGRDFSTGSIALLFHTRGNGSRDYYHAVIPIHDNGDGTFLAIAGNTNDDGGREGWEICEHTYHINDCVFVYH